jgi:hypothetical protein
MVEKSGTASAKLYALQRIFCVQNTKYKVKHKNFLHKVGRSWITEVQNKNESSSDDLQLPEKQSTQTGPKQNLPGRQSSCFRIHKLKKIVGGE